MQQWYPGPLVMAERPNWNESQLRAVALAHRSAHKKGMPELAFGASLKVVVRCFPKARDHEAIAAAMLHEAVGKWGAWLVGGDQDGPDGLADDDVNSE